MRVYHFLNREYGLRGIADRRLKIATIGGLNDPFEMIAAASPHPAERAALLRSKEELSRQRGMLCFSRNWRNPVMWGHYAEKHQGLCLGFDVPDSYLERVRYQQRRLKIDTAVVDRGGQAALDFVLALMNTKFSHWRYENEMRLFVSLDQPDPSGLYFAEFSDHLLLREVIVGHGSTISRAELAETLGERAANVAVKKARLAFRSFAVVTQRRADMWR
ncbi:DUF2971 domain-containing protein [Sphingomonas sp. PR090111-T3T-6A]|uniref:DUF2971 domain-containing protein n=1 Tax=Sphingomonas sp. PR090111-T3T-6A TaxID=685778 RepID=UPI00036FA24C|nr:DUF2971 domain-containing protein [Sphingomonas sp. PR090111-T3T-6A]